MAVDEVAKLSARKKRTRKSDEHNEEARDRADRA
jgi:hypothetical protein